MLLRVRTREVRRTSSTRGLHAHPSANASSETWRAAQLEPLPHGGARRQWQPIAYTVPPRRTGHCGFGAVCSVLSACLPFGRAVAMQAAEHTSAARARQKHRCTTLFLLCPRRSLLCSSPDSSPFATPSRCRRSCCCVLAAAGPGDFPADCIVGTGWFVVAPRASCDPRWLPQARPRTSAAVMTSSST